MSDGLKKDQKNLLNQYCLFIFFSVGLNMIEQYQLEILLQILSFYTIRTHFIQTV